MIVWNHLYSFKVIARGRETQRRHASGNFASCFAVSRGLSFATKTSETHFGKKNRWLSIFKIRLLTWKSLDFQAEGGRIYRLPDYFLFNTLLTHCKLLGNAFWSIFGQPRTLHGWVIKTEAKPSKSCISYNFCGSGPRNPTSACRKKNRESFYGA